MADCRLLVSSFPCLSPSPSNLQVSPNNILQHRTFPARLRSYDSDLGQVYGVLHAYGGEDILQLIDEGDEAGVVDVDPAQASVSLISPLFTPLFV